MRLIPVSLDIQGFRSFTSLQTFQFHSTSGIGLMRGANGAGKSSVWSALFWCLYDKSERNLTSNNLHSWDGKEKLYVKFNFLLDGSPGSIERTAKPVSKIILMLDGSSRVVSQEELELWLGMKPEVFLQGVFVSQFENSFLDLSPAEKQDFLMALLQVEKWETYIYKASQDFKEISDAIIKCEQGRTEAEIFKKACQQEYEKYSESSKNFEIHKKSKLEALQEEINKNKEVIKNFQVMIEKMPNSSGEEKNSLHEEIEKIKVNRRELQNKLDTVNIQIGEYQSKIKSLQVNQTKLDVVASAKYICPTCGQQTDVLHIQEERKKIAEEIQQLNKILSSTLAKKDKSSHTLRQSIVKQTNLENQIREVDKSLTVQIRQLDSYKNEIGKCEGSVRILEKNIQEVSLALNEFEQAALIKLNKIRELSQTISELSTKLRSLSTKAGMYEFWKRGFKEIQLFLLTEVTTQLEMSYNSALASLGMEDWKLKVSVENETKSGTIQNKFTISVISPHKAEPVPVKSWCGGETQRLRLACALGTFDLIRQLSPIVWDLEIWDEPGQHLSEEGYNDLFQILKQRAQLLGKQIHITDHKVLTNATFDFIRSVTRTSQGSIFQNTA